MAETPLGVYVHVPFCSVRCTYCDFATVTGHEDRMPGYVDALEREIAAFAPGRRLAADTVYVGGGTPSRLSAMQVARILESVRERFECPPEPEITIEANPEDLVPDRLGGLRACGVTRLSIGIQSLDDEVLSRVGRAHDSEQAERAVRLARRAGFDNLGVDFIAGLPGERLEAWADTMRRACALEPDHVSVYLLETDKDSPLGRAIRSGRCPGPDDDQVAAAYEATVDALGSGGFVQYEISNFSRGGRESRHNRKYWTDVPFAGFGLAAHGYLDGVRRSNRRDLDGYVSDLADGKDPVVWRDPFDQERRAGEALMLGLRLNEGVDVSRVGTRYGLDLMRRHDRAWERASASGLLAWSGSRARLTAAGRIRSNELFAELL